MSATHTISFFDTYIARTERDSVPSVRNCRANTHNIIVAPIEDLLKLLHIHRWPKKLSTDGLSKKPPTDTQTAWLVHQLLPSGAMEDISKGMKECVLSWLPTLSISTSRTASWRDSLLDCFWQMYIICDGLTSDLNTATTPLLGGTITSSFHVVDSRLSSDCSPLHFSMQL